MTRATAELLRKARAGNDDALYELTQVIQEPAKYKVMYLEIALAHLKDDQLPPTYTLTEQYTTRSWAALPALFPAVKRDTTAKLIEGLDGIIGWIYTMMRHWIKIYHGGEKKISTVEGLFRHITQPLCPLISLDDRLAVAIFSSEKVLTTIHQIWSINLETHPARTGPIDKIQCAVIKLIERFTIHSSEEGNFHLLQALASSPRFLSSFCEGLSWRFRNTIIYHHQHKSDTDTGERLFGLGAIARILFEEAGNPAMSAALRRFGCFTSWIAALVELQEILAVRALHFQLDSVILLATHRYGRPTQSFSDMVTAGLIPLFISMLSNLDWGSPEDVLDALRTAQHLSRMALYPRTAHALNLIFTPENESPSVFRKGAASIIMGILWTYLWRGMSWTIVSLSDVPGEIREVVLCDSRLHRQKRATSGEKSFEKPQCCSGCHLVVYCSEACQREDWNGRHKSECRSMKRTSDERRRSAVHYSQANRHLHVRMIMTLFCSRYTNILNECDHTSANKSIFMVDASSGLSHPKPIEEVPLVDFQTMFYGSFDSPEMEARKDEIIKDFTAQPSSTTRRLWALVLYWDIHRRVHLLVETFRDPSDTDEGSSYEVTQTIVSIEDTQSSQYQYQSCFEVALHIVIRSARAFVVDSCTARDLIRNLKSYDPAAERYKAIFGPPQRGPANRGVRIVQGLSPHVEGEAQVP
ncbi:hypothetical protein BKA70DRAFT_1229761 [Coprinopsis sp. MPI-PUGE-AT-0042]|nr:hypothetical protein BKA70DRAFT_1229761 [Coprinopsis sp. MPI-PUGE-AT-0042]